MFIGAGAHVHPPCGIAGGCVQPVPRASFRDGWLRLLVPALAWHAVSVLAPAYAAGAPANVAPHDSLFVHDPAPSTYTPGPRTDTLIVGATVLDGAGGRRVADVLMRDGRIVAYAPQGRSGQRQHVEQYLRRGP